MKHMCKVPFGAYPKLLVAWCLSISCGLAQQPANQIAQPSSAKTAYGEAKMPIAGIPSLPGVVVQQHRPPSDKNFESLNFYWWQVVKQPKAVLVLADEEARTSVFLNKTWVEFLRSRGWNLLIVGVKSAPNSIVLESALANFEQKLFSWIELKTRFFSSGASDGKKGDEEKVGGAVPLFFHASGAAAFWMESIMLRKPTRFAAWLSVDQVRLPEIPRVKDFKTAPGGFMPLVGPIVSSGPISTPPEVKKYYEQLEHFEEMRSRNSGSRVSFLPWSTGSSQELRDSFARLYLETAANSKSEEHLWLNTQTLSIHPLSATDKSDPSSFGWLPSQELIGPVKLLRPAVLPLALPSQTRSVFKTEEFTLCELRWIKTVQKPKAVLVIAANQLPAYIRSSTDWINFARDHDWAILLMSLKEGRIPSVETAAINLEMQLNLEIDTFVGPELKNIPLITYAQGTPAIWLQTLMLRQPSRYLSWITLGAPRFPSVTAAVRVPPGLIISQNDGQFGQSLLHFEDLRAADIHNPVCLLPLSAIKPPVTTLETTFRVFIDAAARVKQVDGRWLHLNNLIPPPSEVTSRPNPKHYAWFPSAAFLGVWKTLRQDTVPLPLPIIVKRSFKTKIAEVPELKLFVRIPSGLTKDQVPNGVLCFCTWQQEDTTLINRLKNSDDSLVAFANRQGMAMITWNTASMLPEGTDLTNITPETEADIQQKFNAFGEEWRAAIKKVCHEFKLQDKEMLLHGVSRGATFAHQISMRYPQQFLAVHTHIGNHYNETLPREAKETFWLVTTGELDGGFSDSMTFYNKLKELGAPTIFKAGESLGHATRRDIEELGAAFFTYVLDLRSQYEMGKAPGKSHKDNPVKIFLKAVATPPWLGDYINHQAYQRGNPELSLVPVEQLMPLPSEEIAKAWGMSLDVALTKKEAVKNFAAGK